jgi:hypothetical protein
LRAVSADTKTGSPRFDTEQWNDVSTIADPWGDGR